MNLRNLSVLSTVFYRFSTAVGRRFENSSKSAIAPRVAAERRTAKSAEQRIYLAKQFLQGDGLDTDGWRSAEKADDGKEVGQSIGIDQRGA